MDNAELVQLVARLRRTFPRQVDVLSVCEAVEGLIGVVRKLQDAEALKSSPLGPKRDRAEYMRGYRARKRA